MIDVGAAEITEAEQICLLLRHSITELCVSDHAGQPEVLSSWLANKTTDNVSKWIAGAGELFAVATIDSEIAGVGLASQSGEILLNYVSPDFRFRGVSKAIVHYLEDKLSKRGISEVRLTSTETAKQFYLSVGYNDNGAPKNGKSRTASYPMVKNLN